MRGFRPIRFVTIVAVVGSCLAVTGGAVVLTAGPAGATVSNAGAVHVAFAGSLSINGPVPIVITGITGTADGTVDSAGNLSFPKGSISFPTFTPDLPVLGPSPVTIQPTADWTGTIDPNSGALTLAAPQTAHLALPNLNPADTDCPVGPLTLNLTTSGGPTAAPYDSLTGKAEIVDGTFGIPAIPTDSATLATCPDAAFINSNGGLPLAGGLSVADLTATFTPILVAADSDLALSGVPANITMNATGPSGATVTFTSPTAADEDSPATATVGCLPASGSTFAIGTTMVTCTATDADDSPSTVKKTFTVTVKGAAAQLQDLLAEVTHLGPGTSFFDQVSAALASYNAGKNAACSQLAAFIHHAQAQAGKHITSSQADFLVTAAARIQSVIGC
jgi:hypothetical protein